MRKVLSLLEHEYGVTPPLTAAKIFIIHGITRVHGPRQPV